MLKMNRFKDGLRVIGKLRRYGFVMPLIYFINNNIVRLFGPRGGLHSRLGLSNS